MTGVQLGLPVETKQVGGTTVYTLVFPFLPPSKNVYDHWPPPWKSSAKKKWIRWTAHLAEEQQIPLGLVRVGLAARLVFASRAKRDVQNYAQALWHWVPDGLVRAGVLLDDDKIEFGGKQLGIEFGVDLRKQLDKSKRQRTIVTVAVPHG